MIFQPPYHSKFLKADARAKQSTAAYACYESNVNAQIQIRDVFLYAGKTFTLPNQDDHNYLIVPVVGGILVQLKTAELQVESGQVVCFSEKGVSVSNPFQETVNFLLIAIGGEHTIEDHYQLGTISINESNQLIKAEGISNALHIGVYDSRTEEVFKLASDMDSICLFIINGSFEIEGRLLEFRDSLFLWGSKAVAFESLSEAAIILSLHFSH